MWHAASYSAPLLRSVGVDLPIYPGKGYSATFPISAPEGGPSTVSGMDDGRAISRLGNQLRAAAPSSWAALTWR